MIVVSPEPVGPIIAARSLNATLNDTPRRTPSPLVVREPDIAKFYLAFKIRDYLSFPAIFRFFIEQQENSF